MTNPTEEVKLPELQPHQHPDYVGGMVWTEMEIRAIKRYAQAALQVQAAEIAVLTAALARIERWELPPTGKFWDEEKTRPTSFGAEHGSNGEREYMRAVARAAIDAARQTTREDL